MDEITVTALTDVPLLPDSITLGTALVSWKSDIDWEILESVEIYLQGFDSGTEPSPSLDEWFNTNKQAIAENDMIAMTAVSSWSIVVDIEWKNDFRDVRKINTNDDTLTP